MQGTGEIINNMLTELTTTIFYAEQSFSNALGSNVLDFAKVNSTIFNFAIALIILKFLKKGFDVYIGEYSGDRDNDPKNLAKSFILAIITALSFRVLYDVLVNITREFMDEIMMSLLTVEGTDTLLDTILNVISNSLFSGVSALIIVICYCILWIKFHILGVEMFILRLGFPISCVGLLDSDRGMFAPYLKKIFVICITAVVQIFLLRLSVILVGNGHLIWGIAVTFASIKAPKSLNEFMFSYGGGVMSGALNVGYQVSQLMRIVKRVGH